MEFNESIFGFNESILGFNDSILGFIGSILGLNNSILGFNYSILGFHDSILGFYDSILEFNDSILGFNDSLLGFNECLEDDREKLARTVYAQQLKKVTKTHDDFYRVEKVLRSHMRNKLKENFVKWLGYPEKFNSWVPAEQVKDKLLLKNS